MIEKMIMRMGMSLSSLPPMARTSVEMPAFRAPERSTMARKPPSTMTNRQTSTASTKPSAGAISTSPRVAAVMSGIAADMAMEIRATTIRMMNKIV